MQNDHHTIFSIEEKNLVSSIAGLLTHYGYATVTTSNVETLLITLEQEFGIKAFVVPGSSESLKDNQYFIRQIEK